MNWDGKYSLKDVTVKTCVSCVFFTIQLLIFCLLAGYEKEHVREYIKLFPDSTLASFFKGYFACMNTSIADDDEEHSLYVPSDVDPGDTLLVRPSLTQQDLFLLIVSECIF